MTEMDPMEANEESRVVWNTNAAYWDRHMGEGNDFVEVLCWPSLERLLDPQPGQRILDVACGNGLTSRRLAALGAQVTAIDFAEEMLAAARRRGVPAAGSIDYRHVDATDEKTLLALGPGAYDAALSNMALFDMARIDPLFRALARLLVPGGCFVFSMMHPSFNHARSVQFAEQSDASGSLVETFGVRVTGYMTPRTDRGVALRDQPMPQPYFHRPLHALLGSGFAAGFVLDGLEERAFPPDHPPGRSPLGWSGRFSEIPPVMVLRMRLAEAEAD